MIRRLASGAAIVGAAFVFLFCLTSGASGQALERIRLALIIANQDYADAIGPLRNPVRDAQLVAERLRDHGFVVTIVVNLVDRGELLSAIREHARAVAQGGAASDSIIYYAGHGASPEGSGRNYLLPTGLTRTGEGMFDNSLRISEIREELERLAPEAAHLVVFDACREELRAMPGARSLPGSSTNRSFAIDNVAWGGIVVAFSTQDGRLAADGDENGHSPFAQAFAATLEEIRTEDRVVSVYRFFERIALEMQRNGIEQEPTFRAQRLGGRTVSFGEDKRETCREYIQNSLQDPSEFTRGVLVMVRRFCDGFEDELRRLEQIVDDRERGVIGGAGAQRAALRAHEVTARLVPPTTPTPDPSPTSPMAWPGAVNAAPIAEPASDEQLRREEEAAWATVRNTRDQVQLRVFLQAYPEGAFRASAQERMAFLTRQVREAQWHLEQLGFDPGAVDGSWGPRTRQALNRFLDSRSQAPTRLLTDDHLLLLSQALETSLSSGEDLTSHGSDENREEEREREPASGEDTGAQTGETTLGTDERSWIVR